MKSSLLLFIVLFWSCKNSSPETAAKQETPATTDVASLPPGFSEFYQRFHGDSLYQMEHIIFPLEGLPPDADSLSIAGGSFRWQQEDWVMHRQVDFQMSDFNRELIPVNELMVLERIVHKNGQFGMVRRFALVAGEWHLIYYAGLNRLR
jgi:hypothetical protein